MTRMTGCDPDIELLWRKIDAAKARSVALLASTYGEGTTTVAITLARRVAATGANVLVVDLNLSRPGLGVALNLPLEPGEIDMVEPRLGILAMPSDEEVHLWREPARLIAQAERWRQRWDLVIFDCAPALAPRPGLIPGTAVAMAAEATLLVTLAGRTPASVIRDAWNRLHGAGAHMLGSVLNDRDNPSLLAELQRETHRLSRWLPTSMARLRARLQSATLLGVRI